MIKINYIPTFVGDYNLVGEKMSEICLECYNEIMGTNDPPEKYVLSKDLDICEECGEMKHIIIREHIGYDLYSKGFKWLCRLIDLLITLFYFFKYSILEFLHRFKFKY